MNRESKRVWMRSEIAWAACLLPIALGCSRGLVTGSQSEAVRLELVADDLGALRLDRCVQAGAGEDCARYPNPHACTSMQVLVGAEGETDAYCQRKGEEGLIRDRITDAVPFVCSTASADGCLRCIDLFGALVWSECADGAASGTGAPGAGEGDEQSAGDGLSATTLVLFGAGHDPEADAELADSIELVLSEYAAALNQIFADEGLDIVYEPELDGVDDLASNPLLDWIVASLDFVEGICQFAGDAGLLDEGFDSSYCWTNMFGNPVCRCAAMVATAARLTCELVAALGEVDPRVYGALWLEMGNVIDWLLSIEATDIGTLIDGAMGCSGSPLVLDLEGDGIDLTSVDHGVRFDLHGHGLVRTAWVQGDDALLALDRDGNGSIDGARELFGEGIDLDGALAGSGFRALALLDTARHGGDESGRVDSGDALFESLRLWNDENHDGRSQPDELTTLSSAGISSLGITATYEAGRRDAHGNDLGLRGSFEREGGNAGAMVDAYLRFAPAE